MDVGMGINIVIDMDRDHGYRLGINMPEYEDIDIN